MQQVRSWHPRCREEMMSTLHVNTPVSTTRQTTQERVSKGGSVPDMVWTQRGSRQLTSGGDRTRVFQMSRCAHMRRVFPSLLVWRTSTHLSRRSLGLLLR